MSSNNEEESLKNVKSSISTPPENLSSSSTNVDVAAVSGDSVSKEMERHLEFLDFDPEDGHLILGCSNLTGRYWVGSLWYFKEPSDAPSLQKALTGVDCDNGVVDGFFIRKSSDQSSASSSSSSHDKHMLVALDNGSVEHVNLNYISDPSGKTDFYCMERVCCAQEHDDIITGLTRTTDRVITCSYDKSIVSMDIDSLSLVSRFDNAHSDLISAVTANSLNPNVIASAGCDGLVSSWDLRTDKLIAGSLYDKISDWPTAVEWSPQEDNIILIGTQSGEIGIYDTRNPNNPLSVDKSIDKQIYKFKFSPFRPDTFAVSADTFPVRIFEFPNSSFKLIYEDEHHEDFVRGLAWHPKTEKLWTCGWDHQVFSHDIIQQ